MHLCFCGVFIAFLIGVSSSMHGEQYSLWRALILDCFLNTMEATLISLN